MRGGEEEEGTDRLRGERRELNAPKRCRPSARSTLFAPTRKAFACERRREETVPPFVLFGPPMSMKEGVTSLPSKETRTGEEGGGGGRQLGPQDSTGAASFHLFIPTARSARPNLDTSSPPRPLKLQRQQLQRKGGPAKRANA